MSRVLALMLLGAATGLTGCTLGFGSFQATAMAQPATDVIQTRTFNAIGFQAVPESGLISFGWLRSQETSVPAFGKDDLIPDVVVKTDVNAESGIAIVDELTIGVYSDEPETTALEKVLKVFD